MNVLTIKVETLLPFQIEEIVNFEPNDVTYLQDDPYNPDGNVIFATGVNVNPSLILRFQPPDGEFIGKQTILIKFNDPNFIGLHIQVWEEGVRKYTSSTSYQGYDNHVAVFNFDSSVLSDKTGQKARIKVIGNIYIGLTIQNIEAVNWKANVCEKIISPHNGGGINSTPYNQPLYNGAGVQIGKAQFIVNSDLKATKSYTTNGISELNVDSSLSAQSVVRKGSAATFGVDSKIEAFGIKRKSEAALLKIMSDLQSDSVQIKGGSASLVIESFVAIASYKPVFNLAELQIANDLVALGSLDVFSHAVLEGLSFTEASGLIQTGTSASLEVDSELMANSTTIYISGANLRVDSSLIVNNPYLLRWRDSDKVFTQWRTVVR